MSLLLRCTVKRIAFGGSCSPGDRCASANAECLAGRCRCLAGYVVRNQQCGEWIPIYVDYDPLTTSSRQSHVFDEQYYA